ncbi:MAG TPA: sigma-70 family RNA polymerase sigma factor [Planctomycetota bacterium]|nr:sigma-70 family RNA polymerase sigma factor [Planctomycetota bacterium]
MEDAETARELARAREGDQSAIGELLEAHRARLERLVILRFDRRLRGRVDPADVVQDTFLEATQRLARYLDSPDMPFFLWLRFLAIQRLQGLCREHLGVQKRDIRREIPIAEAMYTEASSEALAARLLGSFTTPSQAAMRAEMKARLTAALDSMDPEDREIIALRHFEELSHSEAARVIGMDESAASKRYLRAIKRLKSILDREHGVSEPPWA